jgi:hypothetical protein
MFASMLMFYEVTNPRQLWDAHWESLSNDIEAMTRCERADPTVTSLLLQLLHQDLSCFWAAKPPIRDSRFRMIYMMSQLATSHNK